MVTSADLAADQAITDALTELSPSVRIFSEEQANSVAGQRMNWLVDPLCGTVPFSLGLGNWGVSVALQEDGHLVGGAFAISAAKTPWSGGAGTGGWIWRGDRPDTVVVHRTRYEYHWPREVSRRDFPRPRQHVRRGTPWRGACARVRGVGLYGRSGVYGSHRCSVVP